MLTKPGRLNSIHGFLFSAAFVLTLFFCAPALTVNAQNTAKKTNLPAWQNYKGVMVGMSVEEVRDKLGAPKSESDADLFYIISETESADIMLDGEKKVRTVSAMFTEEHANPPKFEDVFGKGVTAEPKPDGAIYKIVRFPEAGYWVSYSRMAGDKAMVIVVIQKL